MSDLIAGHVNVSFQNINAVSGQIRSKQLKVLAITGAFAKVLTSDPL